MELEEIKNRVTNKVVSAIVDSGWGRLGKYGDEDFLIVDGWEPIEKALYLVLEELIPEAIEKYYVPAGMVRELSYMEGKGIKCGDLNIGESVPAEVQEAFEKVRFDDTSFSSIIGMPWGFSDEYGLCDYCYNVVRVSPDYYGWQPDYVQVDGECVCRNCVSDDVLREYVDAMANNPYRAVFTRLIDDGTMERLGYKKAVDVEFEAGIDEWYKNDPRELYEQFQSESPGMYVFKIDSVGQFDVEFSLWRKVDLAEEV